jgi:predicted CopG family antitoxin
MVSIQISSRAYKSLVEIKQKEENWADLIDRILLRYKIYLKEKNKEITKTL